MREEKEEVRVMLPDDHRLPTMFGFCAAMCAVVAERRGGIAHTYMKECCDFMREVLSRDIAGSHPLPADFDNRVSAAREVAEAMMEYDA